MTYDLILKNALCILPHLPEKQKKLHVLIQKNKIQKLIHTDSQESLPSAHKSIDLDGLILLPGVIDSQVHFREPGLTHKEDIESGSKAALLGGVCTFLEMPNTKPATDSKERLLEKISIAKETSWANFGFFMGATASNLDELIHSHTIEGQCGVKIFLGSSTGDLLLYAPEKLEAIFKNVKSAISIHSEDEERLKERQYIRDQSKNPCDHPHWRDVLSAFNSTKKVIELARKCHKKIHLLHITSQEEIEFLAQNKDICTVEVTPQHLFLKAPDCYERLGTYAQMNPPIREERHQQALKKALKNGVVDVIGSDHAPHTKEEKDKGYPHSPSGMPGVQTILPLMLNAVSENLISIHQLCELLCQRPAQIFNLKGKGVISEGFDADFTVVDLNKVMAITHNDQASKCGHTPFHGTTIKGWPVMAILGGEVCMENGKLIKRNGTPIKHE